MPSMRGLRHLYERNSSLGRLSQRTNRVRDESIHQVYETFTGDATTHSKPAELKAWTGNGLCIFSCFLEDPTGPLYKTQRFAAVRGYIAYEDRWYESLSDMRTERSPGKDDPENQFRVVTKSRAITAQPVVEETDDERTLRLGYKIRCSQLQFDNRWLILGDLVSALLKGDIATLVSCSGQHEIRYDVDKDVRYAVEQGLLRWAQQYGFVLSYFLRRMNGTSGMYFGEGPALYTTYIHYKNSRQVGLFRCPGCLDCLLDRFNDATEIYRLSPDRKGKVHLYGLKETPITVQWERVSPQSPSPRPEMEPTSPKPGDDSNSPLQERDP